MKIFNSYSNWLIKPNCNSMSRISSSQCSQVLRWMQNQRSCMISKRQWLCSNRRVCYSWIRKIHRLILKGLLLSIHRTECQRAIKSPTPLLITTPKLTFLHCYSHASEETSQRNRPYPPLPLPLLQSLHHFKISNTKTIWATWNYRVESTINLKRAANLCNNTLNQNHLR